MKSRSSSFVAIVATILLHVGLAFAVAFALPDMQIDMPQQEPIKIALWQPNEEPTTAQHPVTSTTPSAEKPNPQPKSHRPDKPKRIPHTSSTAAPARAETTTAMQQQAPSAAPSSSPAPPSPPAAASPTGGSRPPPQTSEPIRTSATDASYASTNRLPPYPRISQSNDEEGTVVLRVLVKADGTAGSVEIKQTSGFPRLDEAAKNTVRTWRFSPATVDGKPVAEWYQLAIPFTLQNN